MKLIAELWDNGLTFYCKSKGVVERVFDAITALSGTYHVVKQLS